MRHKIITIMLLGILAAGTPVSALAAAKVSPADAAQINERAAVEAINTLADGWNKIGSYWYFYEGGKPAVGQTAGSRSAHTGTSMKAGSRQSAGN